MKSEMYFISSALTNLKRAMFIPGVIPLYMYAV